MDFDRIYRDFMELARIGRGTDGSVTRLLFSESFWTAAHRVRQYMEEAGLSTWIDACGNVHGTWDCGIKGARTIYMGSHQDTAKQSG